MRLFLEAKEPIYTLRDSSTEQFKKEFEGIDGSIKYKGSGSDLLKELRKDSSTEKAINWMHNEIVIKKCDFRNLEEFNRILLGCINIALRDQKQKIKNELIDSLGFNCKYTDTELREKISKIIERI